MQIEGDVRSIFSNDFQKKIEALFVRNNQKKFEEITKALKDENRQTAYRLVHTLKSNAGQLNMAGLRDAAAKIEQQLNEGACNIPEEHLNNLKAELEAVLADLAPLAAGARNEKDLTEQGQAMLDMGSDLELLEQLEQMLEMGNPDCRYFISNLSLVPGSGELIQQIDDLEFEKAIGVLAVLKQKIIESEV